MKCELCHQAEAETVFYRTTESGGSEELYVCKACAERERVFGQERGIQVTAMDPDAVLPQTPPQTKSLEELQAMGIPPKELFGKLGEMFGEMSRHFPPDDSDPDLKCPTCGASFNDLRGGGLIGCADCYTAFEKALAPLLDELHLCTDHSGDPSQARRQKIAAVQREFAEAVQQEDYPRAKALKAELDELLAAGADDEEA